MNQAIIKVVILFIIELSFNDNKISEIVNKKGKAIKKIK